MDFRVSGLPHAAVKQAESFRVRELVKKIESHPHREALQADLQQNNVYNPFSDDSKAMIRELGNVEFFELCDTIPKVQCSQCLLCWNLGVIYCICGQFLVESGSSQSFHQWRLDAFLIQNYVIRMGRPRGARHGEQKEHFLAHNTWKRCIKKNIDGIHDRFQRDSTCRDSKLKNCIEMVRLAQEDHSHRLSKEEPKRYQGQWHLTLNKSGKNAPMRLRSDFRAAVTIKIRLQRESGEDRAEPTSPQQHRRCHPSSLSDSWWNWDTSKSWWSSLVQFLFNCLLQLVSFEDENLL